MTRSIEHTLTFKPRIQLASESMRATRAEIDLDAIAHNLAAIRSLVGRSKILSVVKADAYGHGVIPVAMRLESEGVNGFGVALAEEGLELREAGIHAPILILNGAYGQAHREVLESDLTPVVYDLEHIERFDAVSADLPYRVHLKIDTGMSRLGVPRGRLESFLNELTNYPRCVIAGVMTHFSSSESDARATAEQMGIFEEALRLIRSYGHAPTLVHAANTGATFLHPECRLDMVRPGGGIFGVGAGIDLPMLKPAMRFRTEVLSLRTLPPGSFVGYDRTFQTKRVSRIATIPLGYGDGLLRELSNRGEMLVHGKLCPIVGRVSMDLTSLDVTDVPEAQIGDEVVILGEQKGSAITADEIAKKASALSYNVLTNVSRRVPRTYRSTVA